MEKEIRNRAERWKTKGGRLILTPRRARAVKMGWVLCSWTLSSWDLEPNPALHQRLPFPGPWVPSFLLRGPTTAPSALPSHAKECGLQPIFHKMFWRSQTSLFPLLCATCHLGYMPRLDSFLPEWHLHNLHHGIWNMFPEAGLRYFSWYHPMKV